jgi:hypothetical protein
MCLTTRRPVAVRAAYGPSAVSHASAAENPKITVSPPKLQAGCSGYRARTRHPPGCCDSRIERQLCKLARAPPWRTKKMRPPRG